MLSGLFVPHCVILRKKKTKEWSWQTFWLIQAGCCWLIFPIIGAWITIPHLLVVLHKAPAVLIWKIFALGAVYGIGGTAFGMAIRYIGFSLTYAIAIGISCVFGTLLPPIIHGTLVGLWSHKGSEWIICGIVLGVAGIALCGLAGRFKELNLPEKKINDFSLATGLPLCLLAGILSSVYGIAIDVGQPIADIAASYGAKGFQTNVIYLFTNSGAFLTTFIYCMFLHKQNRTHVEFSRLKLDQRPAKLFQNYLMAILTGLLWYAQFFFYGLAHVRMGNYKFTSWAIHMIMLVLFSCITGLLLREWRNCGIISLRFLVLALFSLIVAVISLTYGNYLAT